MRSGTSAHPMEVVADSLWCKENILKAVRLLIKKQAEKHFIAIIRVMFHQSCLILLYVAVCLSTRKCQLRSFRRSVGASCCCDGRAAPGLLEMGKMGGRNRAISRRKVWACVMMRKESYAEGKEERKKEREGVKHFLDLAVSLLFSSVAWSQGGMTCRHQSSLMTPAAAFNTQVCDFFITTSWLHHLPAGRDLHWCQGIRK